MNREKSSDELIEGSKYGFLRVYSKAGFKVWYADYLQRLENDDVTNIKDITKTLVDNGVEAILFFGSTVYRNNNYNDLDMVAVKNESGLVEAIYDIGSEIGTVKQITPRFKNSRRTLILPKKGKPIDISTFEEEQRWKYL